MSIRKARQAPTWRIAPRALLLATSLSLIPGSAEARDAVLRIGWDSKAPYHYKEQKGQTAYLTGMDVELMRMIADDAGFKIDFEEVDWVSNLVNVRSGESDVALGSFYHEDRALYALFSDPYRVEKQVLFLDGSAMPQFAPASVQDFLEQLKSQSFRLGIVDDYFYGTEATAILHSEEYAPLISMARSEGLLLNLFLNEEIDGFISDRLVGAKAVSQLGLSERLREYPLVLYEANVHAMFSRATSSAGDVVKFNRSLADLKASGAPRNRFTALHSADIAVHRRIGELVLHPGHHRNHRVCDFRGADCRKRELQPAGGIRSCLFAGSRRRCSARSPGGVRQVRRGAPAPDAPGTAACDSLREKAGRRAGCGKSARPVR